MSRGLNVDFPASRPSGAVEASRLEPSVKLAIESAVSSSIGSLPDNLNQVIVSRLNSFAPTFFQRE